MNLADNLKKIRNDNKLSQEQLAEKLGVSRQSVSKWESGQAYPEMDKVLQICQLFNLNIDELLNQDIKEVSINKQSKNNVNKFIDDFLGYITKTIDMFSSMKLKAKVKCIFEQLVIIGLLIFIFMIIGFVGVNLLFNIISFLPDKLYFIIFDLCESIYITIALILGIALLLHIFKVRYLDYYVIVKEQDNKNISETTEKNNIENNIEENITSEKKQDKIVLEKKSEKIIIRDPNHSGYKFISGLLKIFLFLIKTVVAFVSLFFCLSLIALVFYLIVSLILIKTGFLFIGSLVVTIALIIINLIILIISYNFIISKKNKKSRLAISFVISLFLIGIGSGLISIGITQFNYVNDANHNSFIEEEKIIKMTDNLFFEDYYGMIDYVESDNEDIKVVYKHSKYCDVILDTDSEYYYFYPFCDSNFMEIIRAMINDINNKEIINYAKNKVIIYTSKENILKLNENRDKYFENRYAEIEENNNLNMQIEDLTETLSEQENEIRRLKDELAEKDELIESLNEQIENNQE